MFIKNNNNSFLFWQPAEIIEMSKLGPQTTKGYNTSIYGICIIYNIVITITMKSFVMTGY